MTVWVFGDSLSTPHHLDHGEKGWPELLAESLNTDYKSFARPAADNLYIYHSYLFNLKNIQINDIVVVGWSHPSRKSFVFDENNALHISSLDKSFIYDGTDIKFIRSQNPLTDTVNKWLNLTPSHKGNVYYDTWFNNYYSECEQKINLTAYYHAVKSSCQGTYIPFFFSQQSVNDLDLTGAGHALDFIIDRDCAISPQDAHFNANGHQLWATLLAQYIKQQKQQLIFPVIELFDRLAIARVKHQRTGRNQVELDYYLSQTRHLDLWLVNTELINLQQIHNEIWELEKELKSGKEKELPLDEIGRRAIKIRDWNNKRIGIKNTMAEKLCCPVREIKKDHLSE